MTAANREEYLRIMETRHSVRQYTGRPIPAETREKLGAYLSRINEESGLHIQIVYDEPECFGAALAKYGRFGGCRDYISLVGKKDIPDLDERCGYYGELLVLEAQRLGLNTCWAALTHGKSKAETDRDEREVIIISLGYGTTSGNARKSKTPEEVSNITSDSPAWFREGVHAALLAPTAVNQQKFRFTRTGGKVRAEAGKIGPCLKIDLGIVKCHFEIGAGRENFEWEE